MNGLGNKEIMARNIRKYMNLSGKDRNEICKDLGISYSTFTDWVNANKYPRIDKIELMANYFGITKADLVQDCAYAQEEFPPDIRAAARGMMTLSDEDKKSAIDMINFLSKRGKEAKDK